MSSIEQLELKIMKEVSDTSKELLAISKIVANHEVYISDGKRWRLTVIGMAFTMIMQVAGGLYFAGQLSERVENNIKLSARNEARLDKTDAKFEALIRDVGTHKGTTAP